LHGALLVGALGRLALVVKRAARQARYLQQVCQLVVMPQPGNQTRFVGAADLFDRIKACSSFLRYATSAQSLVLLLLGFLRIGGDHVRRRRIASFLFHLGTLFFLGLESLQASLIEIAAPDNDLRTCTAGGRLLPPTQEAREVVENFTRASVG
jgi:hypothetical protein